MTEQEWFRGSSPEMMLKHLYLQFKRPDSDRDVGPACRWFDRLLRLFACGCCCQVWSQLVDSRSRQAVEVAERYADGLATVEELQAAREAAIRVDYVVSVNLTWSAAHCCTYDMMRQGYGAFQVSLNFTAGMLSNSDWSPILPPATQADFLRDLFGNSLRQVVSCKGCGREDCLGCLPGEWLTPTVRTLAQAAYEERVKPCCSACVGKGENQNESVHSVCPVCRGTRRVETGTLDPVRLLILAEALEEAGCTENALLQHLRGYEFVPSLQADYLPRECYEKTDRLHVRGCWALDRVLGLSRPYLCRG